MSDCSVRYRDARCLFGWLYSGAAFWTRRKQLGRTSPAIVIDLAKAVDQLGSRELTLTRVTVAPNGHIGLHNHKDDPTVAYLISGALTNHHDDGTTEVLQAGQAFAEFGPKSHWVENNGTIPATFVFASVSRR